MQRMRIRTTQVTEHPELWHPQRRSPLILIPSLHPLLLIFPPKLLLPSGLDAPTHQSPLSRSPCLAFIRLFHLSHLACPMAPSPSHRQAGSHLLASPFLLPEFHQLLLFPPLQPFSDHLHLWLCRRVFHLLCTPQPCSLQAILTRGILQGSALHLYPSLSHPGPLHLFPGLTPLCHHQATLSWGRTLISWQ